VYGLSGFSSLIVYFFFFAWLALIARPCLAAFAFEEYVLPFLPYLYPPLTLRTGDIPSLQFFFSFLSAELILFSPSTPALEIMSG